MSYTLETVNALKEGQGVLAWEVETLAQQLADAQATIARLSAPVSDEEWEAMGYSVTTDADYGPVSAYTRQNSTTRWLTKGNVETFIAARKDAA